MKNELMYSFRENNVRVVMKDNEPWFVAKDVCDLLEHTNSRVAVSRLDEDEKGVTNVYTPGGNQNMSVVNEYGLYNLILNSRIKEAKEFKRFITHEVIPSIRKRGIYATDDITKKVLDDPQFMIDLLQNLQKEREEKELLQAEKEKSKPKVLLAESIESSKDLILIRDLAVILKQNGIDIGQNRLYEILRSQGYLVKVGSAKNLPTQRSMNLGLFRIVESTTVTSKGSRINKVTKVTGKGQSYFVGKFLNEKN